MVSKALIALAACARFALSAPYPHDASSLIFARAANASACPGYTATNIDVTESGLTADLSLAGTACNTYSEDLQELKLVVEHQTGMLLLPNIIAPPNVAVVTGRRLIHVQMIAFMSRSTTQGSTSFRSKKMFSLVPRTKRLLPQVQQFASTSLRSLLLSRSSAPATTRSSLTRLALP